MNEGIIEGNGIFDIETLNGLPLSEIVRIQHKTAEIIAKKKKKERMCGACGATGHNKSNKMCPNYAETKRQRKREKKRERRREKEEQERSKRSHIEVDSGYDAFSAIFDGVDAEFSAAAVQVDAAVDAAVDSAVYFDESKLDATQVAFLQTSHCTCFA